MKLVLLQMLLSLMVVRYGVSKPVVRQTRSSSCLRFNPYTFEVYMTMVNKPRDYQECIEKDYNDNYCLANSILTLNLVQTPKKEKPPVTGATLSTPATSGSGAPQSNVVNDFKCRFNTDFEFKDDGHILGGEIQLFNHAKSNDHYEVIVYNYTTRDEMVQIKSAEFDLKDKVGWNTIELNNFFSMYSEGKFHLHLLMQFVKNNEDISCDEAQTVFTTNCSYTKVNPPAAVILSQRESAIHRLNSRSAQRDPNCGPSPSQTEGLPDSPAAPSAGTRAGIPVCEEYSHSVNQRCMIKETKDIITTTENEDNTVSVINIQPAATLPQPVPC